ncbi:MAG: homocysteine S-methyltransferase family protein [Candidatus Binatia bacterium]|jgi:methionine synthase I (cobalamin-dependent)
MRVTSLIDDLVAEAPVLTDGAWGTELQRRGLPAGEIGDLWNLSHPEHVEEVARAYVDAGSRIILTNTFRANRIALERCREESHVEEINRAGVAISRRASAGRAMVFASIGPSGKMLMTSDVDEAQLTAAFSEQSETLAAAGADGLVVETMTDLVEARIAVSAAVATGLPVVACMVFDAGKHRDRTIMGVAPQTAAVELTEAGAEVIGANCGIGVEAYIPICAALASATNRPIWIKPNAGLPEFVDGGLVYRMTAEQFAGHAPALISAGARFIGGCCGTTPEFVAALRRRLSLVEPLNH